MSLLLLQLSPIILLFLFGLGLRRFGFTNQGCGQRYLSIVVNYGLPAVIIGSMSRMELTAELWLLPMLAMATVLSVWGLAFIVGKSLALPRSRLGVLVMGAMVMNLAFIYPFVSVAWGSDALARLVLFDFGNGLLALTLVYGLACWYGGDSAGAVQSALKGIATFPPFWALFIAIALNLSNIDLPDDALDAVQSLGQLILFLVPFSLGLYFKLNDMPWRLLTTGIILRSGVGLVLGFLWVTIFQLEGLNRVIVLMACAAPIGFNTLVFAVKQKLDAEFAASLASISVLLGIIYTPLMIFYLT